MTRLLPFRRAKTSLSVTNFVSLLLLTAHLETTRIKLARTAAKSDIASTTVPSNATLLRTSSVVSAVMLATWPEIALIDSGVLIGAMAHRHQEAYLVAQVLQQAELVLAIWLTVRWR
jgi:hypothetical protein